MAKSRGKKTAESVQSPRAAPTGTPLGWTFWSTMLRCWRMWFLRYVMGVLPRELSPNLALGTAYHALLDGHTPKDIQSWDTAIAGNYEAAKRLVDHRRGSGAPPLGKAVSSEKTCSPPPGHPLEKLYTSKPDRVEGEEELLNRVTQPHINGIALNPALRVREFKTAARFKDTDGDRWDVDGEVIGEMVCAGAPTAVVDIIGKFDAPAVRQVEVRLTETKETAWRQLILDLYDQLRERLNVRTIPRPTPDAADFPHNLTNCVNFSGYRCDYYDYCWGNAMTRRQHFVERKNDSWRKKLGV